MLPPIARPPSQQPPITLLVAAWIAMCSYWNDGTVERWVRPSTQPAAGSVGPCVGDTGTRRRSGPHPVILVSLCCLAPAFVRVASAKLRSPNCIRSAWLPIAPGCLTSSYRLCSLAVCHIPPKEWHAVCKNLVIHVYMALFSGPSGAILYLYL
jgi:hypothetical protein